MKMNNKGFFPGWKFITSFFIAGVLLVFIIGMYDFTLVELYEPTHTFLNDSLVSLGANDGLAYEEFENNYTEMHKGNITNYFNLFYIMIFLWSIIYSLIDVATTRRLEPTELIFKSVGGMVFFIYLMQIVVLKVVSYFQIQVVEYLFEDLIASYIPFYSFTYDNAAYIILIWAVVLIMTNWFLGKTEQPQGVFN